MNASTADDQLPEPRVGTRNEPQDALRDVLESALGAQYTVLRLLGRGGMGAVYLARERLLERLVAIKVLPSEQSGADARERFLREARTAALLSHPNIVPLLSFGELGDTLFYIMRYVEGESLEARLRRDGTLPTADIRRILSELGEALGYAHEQGVVHRDMKPDNVLIERGTGRVMLTDFGVARRASTTRTQRTRTSSCTRHTRTWRRSTTLPIAPSQSCSACLAPCNSVTRARLTVKRSGPKWADA